jgi:uncharacterized alpha/beta hydrolase family protein
MDVRQPSMRNLKKADRKKSQVKVGPRFFIIVAILAIVLGAIAISLNLNLEKQERTQEVRHDK